MSDPLDPREPAEPSDEEILQQQYAEVGRAYMEIERLKAIVIDRDLPQPSATTFVNAFVRLDNACKPLW
jgi:hypothetical protein